MNEKKKLQPKVRFREFTGKNAPDWEQRKLGDLSEIVRGASPRPIQDPKWFDESSDIGWLRISDVTNQNGRVYFLEQKISKLAQEKTRVLETPHLLLSIAASVGKPVINYTKTGVHDGFLIFINPKFDLYFMFQWLEMFKPIWQKYGQPGSQVNLNSDIVKNHKINIPSDHEQEHIGQFFEKIDKLITLHQRKLEQLEELKNTLLSKMFPKSGTNIPEIRFSGFTDAWKQRKLGEMSTSFSGGTPTVGVREYYNGEIPFIRSAEIGKCKTELYISKLGLDNSSARLVSKGDILYAMYGATSGEVARSQIDGAINQAILVIKPVQSVDSEYITQWLRKNKQKIIKTFLQGGQGNLSASIIKNLKVYFPTIEEQQKIGNVFNSFDRSLKFHLNRINELKCLKNNLLNKMFI